MRGLSPEMARVAAGVAEHRLKNGLTVLLVPREGVATVHFAMSFGVGGCDEDAGRSGVAHLYEHMAFKGTDRIGTKDRRREQALLERLDELEVRIVAEEAKGPLADRNALAGLKRQFEALEKRAESLVVPNEFDEVYARNGAKGLNAFTSKDMTAYVVALPANRVRLWAVMESQRVKRPVLRQFWRERSVVMEEQRRYDDVPHWRLYDALSALAFPAHPYRTPIIGWMSELKRLTRRDLEAFFRSRYRPDRAAICAVGAVAEREMLRLLKAEFEDWRPALPPPPPILTEEPEQRGPRRAVEWMQANPLVAVAWPIPTWGHRDKAAVDALAAVLGNGESSRLATALVKRKRIALSVRAMTEFPGERYPHLLVVVAAPRSPHGPDEVEAAILEEIERLKRGGLDAKDLEKAVNLLEADRLKQLQDHTHLAATLSGYQAMLGDWRLPLRWVTELRALSPEDVKAAANAYLAPQRLNVVTVRPPAAETARFAAVAAPGDDNPSTWEPPHPDG